MPTKTLHMRQTVETTEPRGRSRALAVSAQAVPGSTRRDAFLSAWSRLPRTQRSVLLLVSGAQLSYAEAAKALGISVDDMVSLLMQARANLALPAVRKPDN